jgi:zinc transport system substrate-binding protein
MTNRTRAKTPPPVSRRDVLLAGSGVLATGLAGCLGGLASGTDPGESGDGPVAVASFFSFYDFGRKIADGTPVTVRNLIPTGLHGHGWEPNASITRDIIEADAFVHVGPEFQPWADRAIQTLKDDDVDTQLINVRENVELVDLAGLRVRRPDGAGAAVAPDDRHLGDEPRLDALVEVTRASGLAHTRGYAPEQWYTFG